MVTWLGQAIAHVPLALAVGFVALIAAAWALPLCLPKRLSPKRRALYSTAGVLLCTALFGAAVTHVLGRQAGLQFLTGYLLEEALSVDNLFVFLLIFGFFGIPAAQQQRVLFWGIFGAMLLRALFIAAGLTLLHQISWIFYFFGALLVFTGLKLLHKPAEPTPPDRSLPVRIFRRFVPTTSELHGDAFWVRSATGAWVSTPLLLVLCLIEFSDVVFALDSIPAIFSITTDPFLVYTSNMCALLGLRALYFLLADALEKLHTLHYGLSAVLVFIGSKMLLHDVFTIGTLTSLAVICLTLAVAVWAGQFSRRS